MDTGLKVGDAMTELPIIVDPDISIKECSNIMDKNHVGALIVKNGDTLAGLVTEQDIVRKAIAQGVDVNENIHEVMEANLNTIDPSADVHEALIKMRDMNIRHLPVMEVVRLPEIVLEDSVNDPSGLMKAKNNVVQDRVVLWRALSVDGHAVVEKPLLLEKTVQLPASVLHEGVAQPDHVDWRAVTTFHDRFLGVSKSELVRG